MTHAFDSELEDEPRREYIYVGPGKHYKENGRGECYVPGEKVLLTDDQAAAFGDRFESPEAVANRATLEDAVRSENAAREAQRDAEDAIARADEAREDAARVASEAQARVEAAEEAEARAKVALEELQAAQAAAAPGAGDGAGGGEQS